MDEAIDRRPGHGRLGGDLAPFAERPVGGHEDGAALVTGADRFEQNEGVRLILANVGQIVEEHAPIARRSGRRATGIARGRVRSRGYSPAIAQVRLINP